MEIEQAKNLLKTVRHAAYATVNADGSPHYSPLMLIYNEDLKKLYVGSQSDSMHCQNFERTGQAFAVIYDSFTKGQGGVYVTGKNAHECEGEELDAALRYLNSFRKRNGSGPVDLSFYQLAKPAQRMYSIDIAKIELYSAQRNEDGLIISEARVEVSGKKLTKP